MKKYLFGVTILISGIGLLFFTPDYQKSTGSTSFVACDDSDPLSGLHVSCVNGIQEVVSDSVEINRFYLGLYVAGIALVVVGAIYLIRQLLVRNNRT